MKTLILFDKISKLLKDTLFILKQYEKEDKPLKKEMKKSIILFK